MTDNQRQTSSGAPLRPCPICQKLSTRDYHPFCSKRCADIDLNKWLNGAYAVPASEADEWRENSATISDINADET